MKITFRTLDLSDENLRFTKQIGVDGVYLMAQAIPGYVENGYATVDELAKVKAPIAARGLEFLNLRWDPTRLLHVLTGGPDSTREIDALCMTIRSAGEVGLPFISFDLTVWRAWPTPWTKLPGIPPLGSDDVRRETGPGRYYQVAGRGDSVLMTHSTARAEADAASVPASTNAPYGQISAEELWERVERMYKVIVPVAEEAGVNIGSHPDDPPEPVYRGAEQIVNSVAGLKKLVDLVPSTRSGLRLCIGTMHEMGEDTMEAFEHFVSRKKVFSIDFRNPRGTLAAGRYREDWLDSGDMDMLQVMRILHKHDYQGSLDPDHAVGIVGDTKGRIAFAWEVAYIKALRAAVQAE